MKQDNKKAIIASGFTAFTLIFFLILISTQKPNTPYQANQGEVPSRVNEEETKKTNTGLQQPRDLYVDNEGNMYLTDSGNFRVEKHAADGKLLLRGGIEGTGDGQFTMPSSIQVDSEKRIYVTDSRYVKPGTSGDIYGRIQVFEESGNFLTQWAGSPEGPYGQLFNPRDLVFNSEDDLFVVDTGNNRILKFKADGTYLQQIGKAGSNNGEFSRPFSIDIDKDGNIFILELGNTRIQVFNKDGIFQRSWSIEPWSDGSIPPEAYLALSPEGESVFVTDPVKSRVYRFLTKDGRLIVTYERGEHSEFRAPLGIAVNNKDNTVVVSDVGINSIHILKP